MTFRVAQQGTDLLGQLFGGGDRVGGLADRHPLQAYSLDWYVDGGGIVPDPSSWPASVAHYLANQLWSGAMYLMQFILALFQWAFGLDLLTGETGALRPVGNATRALYRDVIGYEWFVIAVLILGAWVIKTAVLQRKFAPAGAAIAVSIVYAVLAMTLMSSPERTLGGAYTGVQTISGALLSGSMSGEASAERAQRRASDHLFETVIYNPWMALQFGGPRHCVDTDRLSDDGFPRPVLENDPARDVCRGHGRLAEAFLSTPAGSDERKEVFEAVKDGTGAWDKVDSPAVDIQQAASASDRMTLAAFVFVGALGIALLLGWMSFAVILSALIVVGLFAFTPIVLLVAMIPGWGHAVFVWWGTRLLAALVVKIVYSLAISVLLLVSIALVSSAAITGYAMAFGLQAALYWGLFLKRKDIASKLATAGGGQNSSKMERYAKHTVMHPVQAMLGAGAGAAAGSAAAHHATEERDGAPPPEPTTPPPEPAPIERDSDVAPNPPAYGGAPPSPGGPNGMPHAQSPGMGDAPARMEPTTTVATATAMPAAPSSPAPPPPPEHERGVEVELAAAAMPAAPAGPPSVPAPPEPQQPDQARRLQDEGAHLSRRETPDAPIEPPPLS